MSEWDNDYFQGVYSDDEVMDFPYIGINDGMSNGWEVGAPSGTTFSFDDFLACISGVSSVSLDAKNADIFFDSEGE